MRRSFVIAGLTLSLLSFPALPQQPAKTARIEGVVVQKETEQPIANAQVTLKQVSGLVGSAAGTTATVSTGSDGVFVFKDLKPAAYRVAAIVDSLNRVANGQQIPNDLGRLLFVEEGRTVTGAIIRIAAAGAITGRILDENGQPATGVQVQLMRATYQYPLGKVFQGAGFANVDDRGIYRLFAVPPGRYYLMAGTPPSALNLIAARQGGLAARATRYSVKYYPDVSDLDQALSFEVMSGSESSINLLLRRLPQTFHIRGHAVNPGGGPFPQGMRVQLGFRQLGGFTSTNSTDFSFNPSTGAFDLANVPPGD